MSLSGLFSGLPTVLLLVFLGAVLIAAWLVYYAMHRGGDIRAEFSHGSTKFKLEAKESRKS